jgi:zinc transporter 1
MPIAAEIRKALHDQGIHSCTIQPEYYGVRVAMEVRAFLHPILSISGSIPLSSVSLRYPTQGLIDLRKQVNAANVDTACLVLCPPECNPQDNACCRASFPFLLLLICTLLMLLVAPPPVDV